MDWIIWVIVIVVIVGVVWWLLNRNSSGNYESCLAQALPRYDQSYQRDERLPGV